jgi:hypothetical protein
MKIRPRRSAQLLVALAFAGTISVAQAAGIARVQQSDGDVRFYNVSVEVLGHRAVRFATADGRGTLTVGKAACSYTGELERCLPVDIVLDQSGRKHSIGVEHGTEYVNRTAVAQPLPMSSSHVPPHGLLLLVETSHGTFISVHGTVDGFRP